MGGAFRVTGWREGSFGEEGRSGREETGGLAGLDVRIGETGEDWKRLEGRGEMGGLEPRDLGSKTGEVGVD